MRPILALTALLSIIGGLKVFDLVFIMTRGGPTYSTEVLATMLYRQAFELNEMGVASAIAVILVALVLGTPGSRRSCSARAGLASGVSVSAPRVGMRPARDGWSGLAGPGRGRAPSSHRARDLGRARPSTC